MAVPPTALLTPPGREPQRHPPAELLIDLAAGTASDGEAAMLETHLVFCAACRDALSIAMEAGGALLDALPPSALPTDLFNRTLARLGRPHARHARPHPVPVHPPISVHPPPSTARRSSLDEALPGPLRLRLASNAGTGWKKGPLGFAALQIPCREPKTRLTVLRAPPGRSLFHHGHARDEWTLVLAGGYADDRGRYDAGDFVIAEAGWEHGVRADPAEGCICLMMTRARPLYTGWTGKLAARLLGL